MISLVLARPAKTKTSTSLRQTNKQTNENHPTTISIAPRASNTTTTNGSAAGLMTQDKHGVAVTPQTPLSSRSPEDPDGPRETGSSPSRTKPSPTHYSANIGPSPSAVRYQRQPPAPLDTISASVNKLSTSRASSGSSTNSEPVSDSNSFHNQTMVQSRSSPRSVDNNNDMSQKHGSRSGSSRADPPTQIQFGPHGSMVVPSTIIGPPPRAPSPMNSMAGMQMDPNHPFANNNKNVRDSHRRAESWSGNFPPMCPPSPGGMGFQLGPGGPMHPFPVSDRQMTSNETSSLLGNAAPLHQSMRSSSNQRKRKPGPGSHRRCLSSGSGYAGMYGGGSVHSFDMPPPPPPPRQEQFSPRGEFMKLTSSFRGTPPSPSGRKMSMSPRSGYSASPQGTPRHVRSNSNGRVTFSPHMPPPSPGHGGHGYGAINVTNTSVPDFPMTSQGEAVFLAQKNSHGRHSHRGESTRKRHMRQQSAQLFMEETKGMEQPPACRDVVFLLLFLFHLVGIFFLGNTYGPMALNNDNSDHVASTSGGLAVEGTGDQVHLYYSNLVFVAGASGLFAIGLSTMALGLMAVIARRFVQVALCLAVTISFAWGTIGTGYSPKNVVPITGFIALALSVAYTFIVWDRIPFCSANLLTALSGIKANLSTLMVALFFQAASLGYCIYYTLVVVGVYDAIQEEKLVLSPRMQTIAYTMLGVSFYWTYNVILNIVQVTTAGVISDWWYHPQDVNVFRSFAKSMFYSLGSICFGSLLVGPVRLIRQVSVFLRPSADSDSALMCLHECMNCIQTCVTSCVDGLANHFNSWAFTYIGIYGYGFLDAGSSATELFSTRGWTMIVSDDLVPNILLMTGLVVGGATGCFAHLLEDFSGNHVSSLGEPGAVSFGIGIVLGLVVTSVLFGIVSSSVNAVLVCFAASPVDFENNHPELSHEMRAAWREVWPGCMDVVDLRVALATPSPRHSFRGGSGIPAEFL